MRFMLLTLAQDNPAHAPLSMALFYLFAILAGGSGIGVVVVRDIVRMAVFLMFTLTGVAGLFFTLEAEFLAAVQLVIYVGGTLILIVFGVMLTSKSPLGQLEPRAGEVAIALVIGGVLLGAILMGLSAAARRARLETLRCPPDRPTPCSALARPS